MISVLPANKRVGGRRQLDYHQKKLENPFYNRKKKINHFGGLRTTITILASLTVISALGWFVFASSYWKIKDVSINGLDRMSNDEILKMVKNQLAGRNWIVLPQNNLLFFNQDKFLSSARDKYRFQDIRVRKEWPSKLIIDVHEKTLACIWNEGDKYYLTDSDGYILSETNPLELTENTHPLISNESPLKIDDGRIQIDTSYITSAAELFAKLAQKATNEIKISRFVVDKDIDTIKLVTAEGVRINFSTKESLDRQIEKLLLIKREKMKDDFNNKKYIDLRFGDKVYFQ